MSESTILCVHNLDICWTVTQIAPSDAYGAPWLSHKTYPVPRVCVISSRPAVCAAFGAARLAVGLGAPGWGISTLSCVW
jgi:hypothetical protein